MSSIEIEEKEMAPKLAEEEKKEMAPKLAEEEKYVGEDDDKQTNMLMYDRDTPGYKPQDLQLCKDYADLAIDFYNKQHSTNYRVVDMIRAIGCACAGFYYSMKFTAKLDDDDADAITFGAEVFDGISELTVENVDIVAEGAILNVDALRACYL